MSKSEKSLREQLLEARENMQRQIDILQSSPTIGDQIGGGLAQKPNQIADLTATLKEIEDGLADLGSADN